MAPQALGALFYTCVSAQMFLGLGGVKQAGALVHVWTPAPVVGGPAAMCCKSACSMVVAAAFKTLLEGEGAMPPL